MHVPVKSKLIEEIVYDEMTHHLRIDLVNGQRRDFDGVPADVVSDFIAAPSPGNFYVQEIRDKYPRL